MEKNYIDRELIRHFFKIMNEEKIEYVLTKNMNNELPERLKDGKDIDIIVKINERARFRELLIQNGFEEIIHPLGKINGWKLLYGIPNFEKFKKLDERYNFYIDISYVLSCRSLMPRTWIPLDKEIQKSIWDTKEWDEMNDWWIMNNNIRFAYYIIRSVFDKGYFNEEYICMIEKERHLIDEKIVRYYLRKVFFGAEPQIWMDISNKNYDNLIKNYFAFDNY